MKFFCSVAQLVERWCKKPDVAGSRPAVTVPPTKGFAGGLVMIPSGGPGPWRRSRGVVLRRNGNADAPRTS